MYAPAVDIPIADIWGGRRRRAGWTATLCTVVAVGNNAWLADWCRLLIIRTLAIATEPEDAGRLLVKAGAGAPPLRIAGARPLRISDAKGGRRHASDGLRGYRMTAREVACRAGRLIACGLPGRFPTNA